MDKICSMYITLLPVIIGGILNMVWCKMPILKKLQKPLDNGKNFIDNKRLFGDNKTWKGLVGYLILITFSTIVFGFICSNSSSLNNHNFFYVNYKNTFTYNLMIGLFLSLAYAIFELPNSFIKRRLDIKEGKSSNNISKIFFVFLDQADSVIGCVLVICLFYPMHLGMYLLYVFIGAFTHIVLNIILYFLRLRKNMF